MVTGIGQEKRRGKRSEDAGRREGAFGVRAVEGAVREGAA